MSHLAINKPFLIPDFRSNAAHYSDDMVVGVMGVAYKVNYMQNLLNAAFSDCTDPQYRWVKSCGLDHPHRWPDVTGAFAIRVSDTYNAVSSLCYAR